MAVGAHRVIGPVLPGEDPGWLFLTGFGGRLDEGLFLEELKRYVAFGGLTDQITLHSLRRYSLNRLAKVNLLAAQNIAGHKESKTTLLHTKLDLDFVRDIHESVGLVRGILTNKQVAERRKRLV